MGTTVSKAGGNSKLVNLCRKRKNLTKAAVNCRYRLVSSHVLYFQSLLEMGKALEQFVEEDLIFIVDPDSYCDGNSHLQSTSMDSSSHQNSSAGSGSDSDSESCSGFCRSNTNQCCTEKACPDCDCDCEWSMDQEQDCCESTGVYAKKNPKKDGRHVPIVDTRFVRDDSLQDDVKSNDVTVPGAKTGTAHIDNFWFPENEVTIHDWLRYGQKPSVADPPPNPEAEQGAGDSAWEFLNPFKVEPENVSPNYDNLDFLRKVREEEGIPDLEEDTDHEPGCSEAKRVSEQMKSEEKSATSGSGSKEKTDDNEEVDERKENEINTDTDEEHVEVGFGDDSWELMIMERNQANQNSSESDPQELVKGIRNTFEEASNYGKEVSFLLKEWKVPYKSKAAKVKVFSTILMRSRRHTYMILSRSYASQKSKYARLIDKNCRENGHARLGDLSSTLDTLSVWERKLYEEVKVEEKLRVLYDKEWKRLKGLDDTGGKWSDIDRTHASVKTLLSQINNVVTVIVTISERLHNIIELELQSQVEELIKGLSRMWEEMTKLHQKQLEAMIVVLSANCGNFVRMRAGSTLKAAKRLEKASRRWAARFTCYVETQKDFADLLKNWLLGYKNISEESSRTIPPPALPHAFMFCNDWSNAIGNISGDGVPMAILGFAETLRHLQEKQKEESKERKEMEEILKGNGELSSYGYICIRKKKRSLEEQKARHLESIKMANFAVSNCLAIGLPPIFQNLETFCLQNLGVMRKSDSETKVIHDFV